MIKTGEERRQVAIAAVQQALGAVHHLSDRQMVAEVRGRRVEIILHSVDAGGVKTRTESYGALELRFPLAVRSRFGINPRSIYVHVGPVPIVTTEDPLFDETYVVVGAPSEVVQRALDQPTRAWIQQYGQPHLMLHTDASGALSFVHSVSLPHEKHRQPFTPQLIFDAATAVCHFANTLEAAYRNRRAEIVAREGEASALAWEQHNNELIAAQPLRWLRWVLGGCLAVVVLTALAATVAFVRAML